MKEIFHLTRRTRNRISSRTGLFIFKQHLSNQNNRQKSWQTKGLFKAKYSKASFTRPNFFDNFMTCVECSFNINLSKPANEYGQKTFDA